MLILIYNNNNKYIFTIIISIFNSIKIDNHFVLNIYIYIYRNSYCRKFFRIENFRNFISVYVSQLIVLIKRGNENERLLINQRNHE